MHDIDLSESEWAAYTFGHAELGDVRRTRQLVHLATRAAETQSSAISRAVLTPAAREAAYRFLEQDEACSQRVIDAACEATAEHCARHRRVFVAIDGSSLSLADHAGTREVGHVGNWQARGRGLQTMTGLAIAETGVPIGIADIGFWARCAPSNNKRNRPARTTELSRALACFENVDQRMSKLAPDCQVVYVCDRGFDAHQCIELADEGYDFVIRATHDRRLDDGPRGGRNYLHSQLARAPQLGSYVVDVPAAPGRPARSAPVQVRACRVNIRRRSGSNLLGFTELNAVLVEEVGRRKNPIRWRLLTTLPIDTFEQVREIIRAYGLRWRIEELHRAWKDGGCRVESTQLRKRNAIIKWATILCTVAARVLRLTHLQRETEPRPATEEFSRFEIDAAILLTQEFGPTYRLNYEPGEVPTLAELIRAVAMLGGWTGMYSRKKPGPTVLGRGLDRVLTSAKILELSEKRKISTKM